MVLDRPFLDGDHRVAPRGAKINACGGTIPLDDDRATAQRARQIAQVGQRSLQGDEVEDEPPRLSAGRAAYCLPAHCIQWA